MRRVPRDSSRLRPWAVLAVAAFLVVDSILLLSLFGSPSSTPVTDPAASQASTPLPVINATPTPSAATNVVVTAAPPARMLSALDDSTAWRANTGSCPATPASPEVSTDGGATWTTTDATGTAEVVAPQTLRVLDSTTVEMVALDEINCTPEYIKTFVGGADYARYPDQLAARWYVDPANRSSVHAPNGNVPVPCNSVASLAAESSTGDSAAVLCADQTVIRTTDAGQTWSQSVSVPGAVNLGVTQMGYVIATVGLPECAGVQLIALSDEAASPTPTGCLQVATPSETLPGNVAVSEAAGTLWVWVGDEVKRSLDEGATWD